MTPAATIKFSGRVLVIDDNWISLKLIASMLEGFGLTTVISDSGQDGLQVLMDEKFDLIFLDCSMPEVDGYAVAQQIRAFEKEGRRLPIIAFTANDSIENRRLCKNAGMDGLFAKPYSYTSLEDLLQKYFVPMPTAEAK